MKLYVGARRRVFVAGTAGAGYRAVRCRRGAGECGGSRLRFWRTTWKTAGGRWRRAGISSALRLAAAGAFWTLTEGEVARRWRARDIADKAARIVFG